MRNFPNLGFRAVRPTAASLVLHTVSRTAVAGAARQSGGRAEIRKWREVYLENDGKNVFASEHWEYFRNAAGNDYRVRLQSEGDGDDGDAWCSSAADTSLLRNKLTGDFAIVHNDSYCDGNWTELIFSPEAGVLARDGSVISGRQEERALDKFKEMIAGKARLDKELFSRGEYTRKRSVIINRYRVPMECYDV